MSKYRLAFYFKGNQLIERTRDFSERRHAERAARYLNRMQGGDKITHIIEFPAKKHASPILHEAGRLTCNKLSIKYTVFECREGKETFYLPVAQWMVAHFLENKPKSLQVKVDAEDVPYTELVSDKYLPKEKLLKSKLWEEFGA